MDKHFLLILLVAAKFAIPYTLPPQLKRVSHTAFEVRPIKTPGGQQLCSCPAGAPTSSGTEIQEYTNMFITGPSILSSSRGTTSGV